MIIEKFYILKKIFFFVLVRNCILGLYIIFFIEFLIILFMNFFWKIRIRNFINNKNDVNFECIYEIIF